MKKSSKITPPNRPPYKNFSLPEALASYEVVSASLFQINDVTTTLINSETDRKLLLTAPLTSSFPDSFEGALFDTENRKYLLCETKEKNALALRKHLPFTSPILTGTRNSFGFGDRLGNAGPAHIRSLGKSGFIPVLAQQSVRELERTQRTPEAVINAAVWAVFQEGHTDGYGADADHLKTFDDIDRTIGAGFTMFTLDPSDYVNNRALEMKEKELKKCFLRLPWESLGDHPESFLNRYAGVTFTLMDSLSLTPGINDVRKAAVKFLPVVIHAKKMYEYLKNNYPELPSEVELSIDETPFSTTPVEHLIIATELQRAKVEWISLAPRFCGVFQKGIDFKGNINDFCEEYRLHQAIAAQYGGYKLSIHTGSDKFRIYDAISQIDSGKIHIKTAGTSYLEALRIVAAFDPGLFRKILKYALRCLDEDRKTYDISADPKKLPNPSRLSDENIGQLLDNEHGRQILHVSYGSILTHRDKNGKSVFYDQIMSLLHQNKETYESLLYHHFRKHIRPFEIQV